MVKFTDLYNYVFEDKAIITHQAAHIARAHENIRKEFEFLNKENGLRQLFLNLLSALQTQGAKALKEILYGLEKSTLTDHELQKIKEAYDDENIKLKFQRQNSHFKYFSGEELEQAENDFVKFFKACKLTGDYIERNNNPDDTIATEIAYKMLVICGASHGKQQSLFASAKRNIDMYTKQNPKLRKPLHDFFAKAIDINDPPLKDLVGWRTFIEKHNYPALEYFKNAPAIESELKGKAPKSLIDAEVAFKKTSAPKEIYDQIGYTEIAELGKKHKTSTRNIKKCIEIYNKRKKKDHLPNISIDGATHQFPGYHLVKIPIDDPHPLFIGDETNCCLTTGGNGQQCVIDGMTKENNGFYVLLKQVAPVDTPPTVDSKIDYTNYEIVGAGYSFISLDENLVIDSWENKDPETDDKVIVPLLLDFAERTTALDNNIVRVTIGAGGKTPQAFDHKDAAVSDIEKADGYQYVDSFKQYLLHFNKEKLNIRKQKFIAELEFSTNPIWDSKDKFEESISHITSYRILDKIKTLFFVPTRNDLWKNSPFLTQLRDAINPTLIAILYNLDQNEMLTDENLSALYEKIQKDADFLGHFRKLPSEILNSDNFKFLVSSDLDIEYIVEMLTILQHANPKLLNSENRALISQLKDKKHIKYACEAASELSDWGLLNDENFKFVMAHAENGKEIANELYEFAEAYPNFLNEENFKLVTSREDLPWTILKKFKALCAINPIFLNNESLALLAKSKDRLKTVAIIWVLNKTNPSLVNIDNLKKLTGEEVSLEGYNIFETLETLENWNKELVNDDNLNLIIKHSHNLKHVPSVIREFLSCSVTLKNQEYLTLLVENIKHHKSAAIESAIYNLYKHNKDLLNVENFKMIMLWPENAQQVVQGLIALYEACLQMTARPQQLFTPTDITPTISKLQKFLLGDSTVSFTQEELDALHKWKIDDKSKNMMKIDLLPKATQIVEDSSSLMPHKK